MLTIHYPNKFTYSRVTGKHFFLSLLVRSQTRSSSLAQQPYANPHIVLQTSTITKKHSITDVLKCSFHVTLSILPNGTKWYQMVIKQIDCQKCRILSRRSACKESWYILDCIFVLLNTAINSCTHFS